MKAAEKGDMDIVVKLLKAGADPFQQDRRGLSACDYARIHHPEKQLHQVLQDYMSSIAVQQQQQ